MNNLVYMLIMIPPKYAVSDFIGYRKRKSALMMFDQHADLKNMFINRYFWSKRYYVSVI
jgi:putative transposase